MRNWANISFIITLTLGIFQFGVIQCENCPCQNGGICESDQLPNCKCVKGFYGEVCEFIDECQNNPCPGFSTCLRQGDGFKCVCRDGYKGDTCEIRNPCFFNDDCFNNGVCVPESNYKSHCLCDEEFYGKYCQFTNSCIDFPCRPGEKCRNDEDAYHCECETGFSGQNCQERDPCILDKIVCLNGQYCQRIDDKTAKCSCRESDGESCGPKKTNLCSLDVSPCLNGGMCKIIPGVENKLECKCPTGFNGLFCEIRNPCKLNPILCGQHTITGTCHRLSDTEVKCECFENFYGDNCEMEDVCRSNPCLNEGICRNEVKANFECQCPQYYYGKTCEIHVKHSPDTTTKIPFENQEDKLSIPKSDGFVIPEKAFVGEKVNFHAAVLPEKLTSDVHFQWIFGDGTSHKIGVPDIFQLYRNRKRDSNDDDEVNQPMLYAMEHVYNHTGVFSVQIFAVSDLSGEKNLKKTAKVTIDEGKCISTVRIHNVGHVNEMTPTPVYRRQQSILAWAILYVVCNPPKKYHIKHAMNEDIHWRLFLEDGNKTTEIAKLPLRVHSQTKDDQSIVSFPPWSLSYGRYRLQVTAVVDVNENVHNMKSSKVVSRLVSSLSDADNGAFHIIHSPPRARISGGDYRVVRPNDTLVLDASESNDPDFSPAEGHKLRFSWSCSNANPDTSTCGLSSDSIDWRASRLAFAANKLQPNVNNTFSLTITSDKSQNGRSLLTMTDTARQIIVFAPNVFNAYSIDCLDNCGQEVIPEKKTLLSCSCGTNGNCTSRKKGWDIQFTPKLDNSSWIYRPVLSNDAERFVCHVLIKANALKNITANTTLTLSCRAKGDIVGKAEYSFRVHQPPVPSNGRDGRCKINPAIGTTIETKFTMDCPVFISHSASPITYSIYAKIQDEDLRDYTNEKGFLLRHELVGTFSPGSTENKMYFDFILPAGNSTNGYVLPISVEITDSMGSSVNVDLEVNPTVKPTELAGSVSDSIDYYSTIGHETIKNLLFSGNRGGLLRLILAEVHQIYVSKVPFPLDMQKKIIEEYLHTLNMTSEYSYQELTQTGSVLNIRELEQLISVLYAIVIPNPYVLSDMGYVYVTDLTILVGYQLEAAFRPLQDDKMALTEIRTNSKNYIEYLHLPMINATIDIIVTLLRLTDQSQEKILTESGLHEHKHHEAEIAERDAVDRDYFLQEFPRYSEFAYTNLVQEIDEATIVTRTSKLLMDSLRRLSNALGSGLYSLDTPVKFDHQEFLSIYIAIFQADDLPGMKIPHIDYIGSLFEKNYIILSKSPMNVSSVAVFLQLIAVVTTFSPFLDERQDNPIDTPLLHVELSELETLETVTNVKAIDSPHEIHLTYLNKQDLHVRILDKFEQVIDNHHGFMVNKDLSNLSFEEIIVHHFSLPPSSKFYVLIKNTFNLDVQMVLKIDFRPTCVDFQTKTIAAHNASSARIIYQFHTAAHNRSDELLDYYATFWPTKESIEQSGVKFVNSTVEIDLAFARLRCISRRQIVNGEWVEEGCIISATTTSTDQLICTCSHLSLFSGSLRPSEHAAQRFEKIELFPEEYDTTLIPFVVTVALILYLILLPIAVWKDNFNRNVLPRLYVMCDIKRIQDETMYLLTLETGNNFLAGTTANVGCQIYGEKGRSNPYVLSDLNVDSTRQNTTADFVISSEKYLGKLEKIRIWHDNSGQHPSWYIRKVTIRDLKTEEIWYFFFDKWLTIKHTTQNSSLIGEILAATDSEVSKYFRSRRSLGFRNYWHQVREHHLWLSGFTCLPRSPFTRAERLTCAMGVFSSYMLILVLLYRKTLQHGESETIEFGGIGFDQDFVLLKGTFAALSGVCICFVLVNLFRRIRRKKIPVLVVQGGVNPYQYYRKRRFGASFEVERKNKKNSAKDFEAEQAEELYWKKKDSFSNELNLVKIKSYTDFGEDKEYFEIFRIPSTDMVETENWIAGTMESAATEGQDAFVHGGGDRCNYGGWRNKKHAYALKIMEDFGLTGELVNVCDENPLCFDYRPANPDHPKQRNFSTISNSEEQPRSARLLSLASAAAEADFQGRRFEIKRDTDSVRDDDSVDPTYVPSDFKISEKVIQFDVALGRIQDPHEFGGWLPHKFLYISWAICILLIILTCTFTIIFGLRYSYRRSAFWVVSLIIAVLESCLVFQPAQVLVFYLCIVQLIKKKIRKTDEELFLLERLRVFWVNKISDIKLWPLKYKIYNPQNFVPPLSGSQAFTWKMHSRRKGMMRRGLLDLFMFSVFMIILLYTMTMTQDYDHFNSLQNMKYMLRTSYDDHVVGDPDAFWNIRDESDFYGYMEGIFIPVVYSDTSFNGERIDASEESMSLVWLQNRQSFLLGVPRVRQLRVRNDSKCDYAKVTENVHTHTGHTCSEDFMDSIFYSNKETAAFSEGWEPVGKGKPRKFSATNDLWKYRSEEETGSVYRMGLLGSYDGGGYIAELGRTREETKGVLEHMERSGWIDVLTRAIFVEFNAYNPNVNLFTIVVLIIERSSVQCFHQEPMVLSTRFVDEMSPGNSLSVAFTLCVIYLMYSTFRPVFERIFQRGHSLHWTLILDFISAIIGLTICVNYVVLWTRVFNKFAVLREAPINAYVSVQNEEKMSKTQLHLYCVLMLLCLCKLWSLMLMSSRRFFIIGFTLSITRPFMLGFLLMGAIFLIPFSLYITINFYSAHESFRSFGSTMLTLIYQMEVGNVLNYRALVTVSPFFGGLAFFCYNMSVVFLYRNIFISALTLGLQGAKETSLQRPFRMSYAGYIWLKLQIIIPSFIRKIYSKQDFKDSLTEERSLEMIQIFEQILISQVKSIEVHRMNQMKSLTENFLTDSHLHLLSKKEKMVAKKNSILKIEEDRLNSMRQLTVQFIKDKLKWDFQVEELEKYDAFNYAILKLKCRRLRKRFIQLMPLLEKYLKEVGLAKPSISTPAPRRHSVAAPRRLSIPGQSEEQEPASMVGLRKYFY